jgi:putative AdoMet-dependent methyltransferase
MPDHHFNDLFDEWAPYYDTTVQDSSGEYAEVFKGYEQILMNVVNNIPAGAKTVLEFGVGTGNLSVKLLQAGFQVIGVEPSEQMRRQVITKRIPMDLRKGHFLDVPLAENEKVDAIVSTYAFHHLTLAEKSEALQIMRPILKPKGSIIFADTCYADEESKHLIFQQVKKEQKWNLLRDLETEYYEFIGDLQRLFLRQGFHVCFEQFNPFVWLMVAHRMF